MYSHITWVIVRVVLVGNNYVLRQQRLHNYINSELTESPREPSLILPGARWCRT